MKKINKPAEPKKTISQPGSATHYNLDMYKDILLLDFYVWVEETVPVNATEVKMGLELEYDDNYYSTEISSCSLMLTWKVEVANPKYDAQLKQYQKKLAKWQAQQ